jgi:hypothetical protein
MDKTISAQAEERKAIRRTTVRERCAYTAARRESNRDRDASRIRIAEVFTGSNSLRIPPEHGYLRVSPGPLETLTGPVMAEGNALIDAIGHQVLTQQGGKGDFIARGFLPQAAFDVDSPYFRFALHERIVGPVAAYLGVVPVLTEIDMWYSMYNQKAPKRSQLWHMDPEDSTQIKVWVHLSDVTAQSGPLTGLNAEDSLTLADAVSYNYGDGYRVADDRVSAVFGPDRLVAFEGAAGTVDFIDTSRCFHFGSRLSPGGKPRRMLMMQYQTPYAFEFTNYRKESPYRQLATEAATEMERLVLGAA